ncbi:MAG: PQQ-dependent sugar dehydrogenase [Acidimicrobiales bacterium]
MKRTLSTILIAVSLLSAACVGGADQSDTPVVAVEQPTTSTRRTIPEEATTTVTVGSTTTLSEEPGPPEDPQWLGQNLQLLTLATLESQMALTGRSGGDDLWIAERPGRVRQIQRRVDLEEKQQSLRLMNTVVLDITDRVTTAGEGGLLGLAFSTNGRFLYVSYTNNDGTSVVAEYEMGTTNAFPETERILLQVEQPFSNHNGGQISLGPDGFLYLALGDGGSGGDPLDSGQDTQTLLGSILRIDPAAPTEASPYGVPADNPFADGVDGRPEIWLWGVRNPWRFSWAAETDDLWIVDVGQEQIEEVTVLRRESTPAGKGANLGWRIMEGDQLFNGEEPPPGHVAPILTYDHSNDRCSITGGYVYRGDLNRALQGVYLFADFCTGEVFGMDLLADGQLVVGNLIFDRPTANVISFGEGSEGELYLLEAGGQVSLIRLPGVGPATRVVDSDDQLLGGEVDDSVQPNSDPEG